MALFRYTKDVKTFCLRLMNLGLSAKEVVNEASAEFVTVPSRRTVQYWFEEAYPNEARRTRSVNNKKKNNLYLFKATDKVAEWLNIQSNKTMALNTVLEWYLRQVELEERAEKKREMREANKRAKMGC